MSNGDSQTLVPVILVGGSGTRLWPLSRAAYPKQFLRFGGEMSLLQNTAKRLTALPDYDAPIIITNNDHRFLVGEQLRQVGIEPRAILLEPEARNTAPAIAAAAAYLADDDPNQQMHVLPSDHRLVADDTYRESVRRARTLAAQGYLVTFGITPTEPATGYGYIEIGEAIAEVGNRIARFVEKPDLETAQAMVDDGRYVWNSGMFLFAAGRFLQEVKALAPDIHDSAVAAVQGARPDLDFIRLDEAAFRAARSISVDYAIFEETSNAAVVPSAIDWSDLGSWGAFWDIGEKDATGSVVTGQASLRESRDMLVYSDGPHVAAFGLENMIIVATEDAVLVTPRNGSQGVKALVEHLAASPETKPLVTQHSTDYRPWGGFKLLATGKRFQVKRLFVSPGKQLSLQLHHHRAEHWVVVHGTAEVTIGDETRYLTENESAYIPIGTKHRLTNPSADERLELIEVQTGTYLGEDDIVRFSDDFGRL